MKRTCLISIFLTVGCVLAVFAYAYHILPLELAKVTQLQPLSQSAIVRMSLILALPTGLIGAWGLGLLYPFVEAIRAKGRLKKSTMAGMWRDGESIAVAGVVVPEAPLLKAPISGTECVAYSYDIHHFSEVGKNSKRRISDFSGFGCTPFVIHTQTGPVKLKGCVHLDFKEEILTEDSNYKNAESYVLTTQFTQVKGLGPLKDMFSNMRDFLTDEDGVIQKNWGRIGPCGSMRDENLAEQQVKPGDEICAFGIFSSTRRALVSDSEVAGLLPVRLIKGEISTVNSVLTRRAIGYFLGAGFVLAFSVACFWLILHVIKSY